MLPVCVLIFASLCVPRAYAPVTQTSSMVIQADHGFSKAAARRMGVEIDAWESDQLKSALPNFMDRACAQGVCIYYRKTCDTTKTSCSYTFGFPARSEIARDSSELLVASGFTIHAATRAAFDRAESRLWLQLSPDRSIYLPLARLDRTSGAASMIGCMRSVWVQGCARPPLPGAPRPAHL